ncbi:hypothetical protein B0H10DRAFT_1943466 [Mycena sp. CBHHK59/15]|nr:hypothetical protein B0H10DRAFT_1943466 [Mycena sp. CBHHK59/15]
MPGEVAEMARRANEVVRLLEELRRMGGVPAGEAQPMQVDADVDADQRAPKRPWEEVEMDDEVDELEDPQPPYPTPTDTKPSPPPQTTAEQDMELIRTKRATTAAGGSGAGTGQPKSKYRKRSRATPPGKCHSCNIRETPEWRRGPDGARTLCNACGLHYAKLMRKREKEHGGAGGAPTIDMDTLRASARADMAEKSQARANKQAAAADRDKEKQQRQQQQPQQAPPPPPPPVAQHHEGSFQLTMSAISPSEVQAQMPSHPHPPPMTAWAGGATRGYAPEQLQHQSFMRTPQVVGGGQSSPR